MELEETSSDIRTNEKNIDMSTTDKDNMNNEIYSNFNNSVTKNEINITQDGEHLIIKHPGKNEVNIKRITDINKKLTRENNSYNICSSEKTNINNENNLFNNLENSKNLNEEVIFDSNNTKIHLKNRLKKPANNKNILQETQTCQLDQSKNFLENDKKKDIKLFDSKIIYSENYGDKTKDSDMQSLNQNVYSFEKEKITENNLENQKLNIEQIFIDKDKHKKFVADMKTETVKNFDNQNKEKNFDDKNSEILNNYEKNELKDKKKVILKNELYNSSENLKEDCMVTNETIIKNDNNNPIYSEYERLITAKRVTNNFNDMNNSDPSIIFPDNLKIIAEYNYSYPNYFKRPNSAEETQYFYNIAPVCNTAINCTITKINPEIQEKILLNFPDNTDISSAGNVKFIEAALGILKFKRIFRDKTYKEQGYKYKSEFQLKVLNDILKITPYPGSQTRDSLAILLNLNPRSIQIWFQNARQGSEKQISREELKSHRVKNYIDLGTIVKIYYKYLYE